MIYDRKQLQAGTETIWDYVACLYPEGNIGEDYNVFFQHNEVGAVHHLGLSSPADNQMQELLAQV